MVALVLRDRYLRCLGQRDRRVILLQGLRVYLGLLGLRVPILQFPAQLVMLVRALLDLLAQPDLRGQPDWWVPRGLGGRLARRDLRVQRVRLV